MSMSPHNSAGQPALCSGVELAQSPLRAVASVTKEEASRLPPGPVVGVAALMILELS